MIPYGAEGKKKNLAYVFLNHTVSLIQKKKDLSNIVCTEEKKQGLISCPSLPFSLAAGRETKSTNGLQQDSLATNLK